MQIGVIFSGRATRNRFVIGNQLREEREKLNKQIEALRATGSPGTTFPIDPAGRLAALELQLRQTEAKQRDNKAKSAELRDLGRLSRSSSVKTALKTPITVGKDVKVRFENLLAEMNEQDYTDDAGLLVCRGEYRSTFPTYPPVGTRIDEEFYPPNLKKRFPKPSGCSTDLLKLTELEHPLIEDCQVSYDGRGGIISNHYIIRLTPLGKYVAAQLRRKKSRTKAAAA